MEDLHGGRCYSKDGGNHSLGACFQAAITLGGTYNPGIQVSHPAQILTQTPGPTHKALSDLSPDHLPDLSCPFLPLWSHWPPSVLEDAKPFPASETCPLLDLLHGNILPVSAQTFTQLPCSPFQSAFIWLPLWSPGSSLVKRLLAFLLSIFPNKSRGWAVSRLLSAVSVKSVNTGQVTVVWMNGQIFVMLTRMSPNVLRKHLLNE